MVNRDNFKIYVHYLSVHYGLKHNVNIQLVEDKYYIYPHPLNSWSKPNKEYKFTHFRHFDYGLKEPVGFDDFCSRNKEYDLNGLEYWKIRVK